MNRVAKRISFSFLFALHYCSCSDSINTVPPVSPRLIIYSILSTQTDTQYARIYLSYNPADSFPFNNEREEFVTDARVIITDGNQTFVFRDTLIARNDVSRYKNDMHLYYSYPMRVEANKTYTIIVSSQAYGSATATTTVPDVGSVNITSVNVLENPDKHAYQDVRAHAVLSPRARAFLYRLYLVFTAENPWEQETDRYKEKYFEVPVLRVATDRNLDQCKVFYPHILKRTMYAPRPGQDPPLVGITFPFPAYPESIAQIQRYHFNVRFKRAVLYLVQFDEPWYKYYFNANLFQDKLAVRLDQPPDYTNISGALGLFASMRVDSSVWRLPEIIRPFDPQQYTAPITYCRQEAPHLR